MTFPRRTLLFGALAGALCLGLTLPGGEAGAQAAEQT